MIGICAPHVRWGGAAELREKHQETQARGSGVPPPTPQEPGATRWVWESDTSTEEDAEGVEQGEIEYLATEAAEDAVGEALVDGDAVREEEEENF